MQNTMVREWELSMHPRTHPPRCGRHPRALSRRRCVSLATKSTPSSAPSCLRSIRMRSPAICRLSSSTSIRLLSRPHGIPSGRRYKLVPSLYGASMMQAYEHVALMEMKPHVYAIVERAYRTAAQGGGSQSLIISGESGAGKTESTKVSGTTVGE
jgi:hypothetical protein